MGIMINGTHLKMDQTGGGQGSKAVGWDLLGHVPVPLRHWVSDGVDNVVKHSRLNCHIPMGQGGRSPFEQLRFIRRLEDYPNMLVSAEHGNAFNHRFYRDHVKAGAFMGAQPRHVAEIFSQSGLIDPKGWVGVYAVAPFVMLIDRRRLGDLPIPGFWADLTDPIYRGHVVFSGWRREGDGQYTQFNKFFLVAMARLLGMQGLARLLDNVPSLLHSAQMPRLAGTVSSPGGIYILPLAQAEMCPRRETTCVVWPKDGALAYPLWLTVKSAHHQKLEKVVDYFHGPHLAQYLNRNRYPALCPAVPTSLPTDAKLNWLGWDFVRHSGTAKVIQQACRLFTDRSHFQVRSCA